MKKQTIAENLLKGINPISEGYGNSPEEFLNAQKKLFSDDEVAEEWRAYGYVPDDLGRILEEVIKGKIKSFFVDEETRGLVLEFKDGSVLEFAPGFSDQEAEVETFSTLEAREEEEGGGFF